MQANWINHPPVMDPMEWHSWELRMDLRRPADSCAVSHAESSPVGTSKLGCSSYLVHRDASFPEHRSWFERNEKEPLVLKDVFVQFHYVTRGVGLSLGFRDSDPLDVTCKILSVYTLVFGFLVRMDTETLSSSLRGWMLQNRVTTSGNKNFPRCLSFM